MNPKEFRQLEKLLIDAMAAKAMTKKQAIEAALSLCSLTAEEMHDVSTNGKRNILKSKLGEVFASLAGRGILSAEKGGIYTVVKSQPVIVHEEKCEILLLAALKDGKKTKKELREILAEAFGTARTATLKDDAQLNSVIAALLSRLTERGTLVLSDGAYSLCEKCKAVPTDLVELAKLRSQYLYALHAKGGEFFEHYFMNLLEKYVTLHGKTAIENTTVGGSEDGGIDGILVTKDCLGFEERILVQTKNRRMTFAEKEIRGFYGALRAARGSRGIFATTGAFHEGAIRFLDSLPDLIGIDGYRLFDMAKETLYGIKKCGGKLAVDDKVIG